MLGTLNGLVRSLDRDRTKQNKLISTPMIMYPVQGDEVEVAEQSQGKNGSGTWRGDNGGIGRGKAPRDGGAE